jgi:hypothetical protein
MKMNEKNEEKDVTHMNKIVWKNNIKASIVLGLVIALVMPLSIIVTANDTTPPTITDIYIDPQFYVGSLTNSYLDISCIVTDNTPNGVAHVRAIIHGPNGLIINSSMDYYGDDYYDYIIMPVPYYGVYYLQVYAVDTSGNHITSDMYSSLFIQNEMSYVHVDDSNTAGPWDGTAAHPFRYVNQGLQAATTGGTVFVHNGYYSERAILNRAVNLIGESKSQVIFNVSGLHYDVCIPISSGPTTLTNLTVINSNGTGISYDSTANMNILNCDVTRNPIGLSFNGGGTVVVSNCKVYKNSNGIIISGSGGGTLTFTSCNIYNNSLGISDYSNGRKIIITNCNIYTHTDVGLFLRESGTGINISISTCNIYNNFQGIVLQSMSGTGAVSINNCNIYNDHNGITISDGISPVYTITHCTFTTNPLAISYSDDPTAHHKIYHNNFINNTQEVYYHPSTPPGSTVWDNGTTGNYWSYYRSLHPTARIVTATGTWDIPQLLYYAYDYHPWVYPNGPIDTTPPSVTVTYPNGGETLSGIVNVTWAASDNLATNDHLKILIDYSTNAGATWSNLNYFTNNPGYFQWNTATYPTSSNYLLRINATDEFFNTGSDISNGVFTVSNNHPPQTPSTPQGPTSGYTDITYTYTTSSTDQDGDQIYYNWSFMDHYSGWLGPYTSGASASVNATWTTPGVKQIRVKARDSVGLESTWSSFLVITITVHAPNKPSTPTGPITGTMNVEYTYSTSTTDPHGDQVMYGWDWNGDNIVEEWTSLYNSNTTIQTSHSWNSPGTYAVKVKAKDTYGYESTWSSALPVHIAGPAALTIESITAGKNTITTTIKNIGGSDATNISWRINITGGFILFVKLNEGTIDSLAPNATKDVTLTGKPGIGIGLGLGFIKPLPTITASAEAPQVLGAEKTVSAKIILSKVIIS